MKKIVLITVLDLINISVYAQIPAISTMMAQGKYYSQFRFKNDYSWDSLTSVLNDIRLPIYGINDKLAPSCSINQPTRIFGWNPWYFKSQYKNYVWNLLTDFCYFDYQFDYNTGHIITDNNWQTASSVTEALSKNWIKVSLAVTFSGSYSIFFSNTSAQNTLITDLKNTIIQRGGKGVNIDFEAMSKSNKDGFTSFISLLYSVFHVAGLEVGIDLQPSFIASYDIIKLRDVVDYFALMGYDYYEGKSTTTGPVGPIYAPYTAGALCVSSDINKYINAGIPIDKFLLGVPYYGREWLTTGNTIPGVNTLSNYNMNKDSLARQHNTIVENVSGFYSLPDKKYDSTSFCNYFIFTKYGNWRQCFTDDSASMARRYDLVLLHRLRGIAIWNLGMDDGVQDYWNLIKDKFSTCSRKKIADTLFDDGGTSWNYYNNENYNFTVTTESDKIFNIRFTNFNTESGHDSLKIFDGIVITSPLLMKASGNNLPPNVSSTGNSITISFKSNGSNSFDGWKLIYNCVNGNGIENNPIAAYEYWFDNDYVNKVGANTNTTNVFNFAESIPTIGVSQGLHSFHIHFKDLNGKWSSIVSQFFTKLSKYGTSNAIVAYEYWFDNNYASKISQTVTAQQNYQLVSGLSTTGLTQGLHSFHIRFENTRGVWSSTINQLITYVPSGIARIDKYEYWFDDKYAQKIVGDISGPTKIYILNTNVSASTLINGTHTFNIRFRQNNKLWSSVLSQSFTKTSSSDLTNIAVNTNKLAFTDNSPLFVYPNPSKGKFTIGIDNDAKITTVKVFDGNGKIIYNNPSVDTASLFEIDLSNYASGVYYVKASCNKNSFLKKIIIER